MRALRRAAWGLVAAVVRTLGGLVVGLLVSSAVLSGARAEATLLLTLPLSLIAAALALLWPFAFPRRRRRRR